MTTPTNTPNPITEEPLMTSNILTGAEALKIVAAEREAAVIAADASWKKTQAMIDKRDTSTWDAERENELRFDTWRKDAAADALRTLELKLIDAA